MSKVFLITGSSRGLGRQLAESILAAGHRVVATARKPEQLTDLAESYGEQVLPVALDVTDPAAAQTAVKAAVDTFGRLDVVINNAGYANLVAVEDVALDDFRAQLETNFFGVVNVTKAALPVLREQGSGHVINVSSVGSRLASVGLSAYQSAKWALAGFAGVLAREVAPLGITVTNLEPGGMPTDWNGSSMAKPPVSEPYQQTVGKAVEYMREQGAITVSDLGKVAEVVLELVELERPPLRLLLGSDAVRHAAAYEQAQRESDERWHELSVSTDAS
ncbi:MAG TPA: SDR family NAD(P)-dependent oxidoreductase [Pseudonocardiaceae bacterium]|nr:SDR family NAD(P)-dependent oxidoreductase [Pseudonocardiaceae bacterium]